MFSMELIILTSRHFEKSYASAFSEITFYDYLHRMLNGKIFQKMPNFKLEFGGETVPEEVDLVNTHKEY